METINCFISYSWETDEHIEWVKKIAEDLFKNGVKILLDQWDVKLGTDLPHFMESSIRESNFVLLICTPTFCKKANAGEGGVGYEKNIVTGEIFGKTSPDTKFVPVLRKGSFKESLPSYLKSKVYIDFRNDGVYQKNLIKLLRHLFDEPEIKRPDLGQRPSFSGNDGKVITISERSNVSSKISEKNISATSFQKPENSHPSQTKKNVHVNNFEKLDLRRIKELKDFAFSAGGLNMNTAKANEWALTNVNSITNEDMRHIKELKDFAFNAGGLNMNTEKANEWALANVNSITNEDMRRIKELKDFAFNAGGLNMNTEKANEWALANVNSITNEDMRRIKDLKDFAFSTGGLNMNTEKANEWALANVNSITNEDMCRIKELKDFAFSAGGLNMTTEDANEWALQNWRKDITI